MGRGRALHAPSFLASETLNSTNEHAKGLPEIWHDFCTDRFESIFWD